MPLPEFDSPPVIETVLSVEFPPLAGWGIPHFGLFWHEIRDRYPKFDVQPPLRNVPALSQGAVLELVDLPEVRCWFIDATQTRLIQVQQDRFIHNWRKVSVAEPEPYPRYSSTRQTFELEWKNFNGFLVQQGFDTPSPQVCEVTYINHVEQGQGWQSFSDLPSLFPCLANHKSESFLPAPGAGMVSFQYKIPEGGYLAIQLQPAIRHHDSREVLQLTLTARIRVKNGDVLKLLDLGHEWVVRGFADFTTPQMHDIWKRRS